MARSKAIRWAKGKSAGKPRAVLSGPKKSSAKLPLPGWLKAVGGYLAGSWQEVKQVRWPNRRATWSLTVAVLLFTAFWAAVILSVDLLSQLFLNKLILKQ
ncbi:MAG: preprotein translocase subunit SecE [Candidatus Chaera renei]|uniref:Preprotein translocase subunit SecE n=1 Tax=Candidatus Chaera renei TaxID=2506947 RepID=A0A4V1J7L0_9BACT|nr:MAG: preprotein translocase subunit SecE [Candidatus Chaera renei]